MRCRPAMRSTTSAAKAGSAERRLRAGRPDERGRHGVDVDAVAAPLDGEALGEVRDGRLGGAVDGLAGQRHEACLRAEVDDAAAAPRDHAAPDRLADEEEALDVDAEGEVEVGLGGILGRRLGRAQAGVVDEDVDAPEASRRRARPPVATWAGLVTSMGTRMARRPMATISASRSAPSPPTRRPRATSAPALASASAMSRPRPRAAPVTSAVRPWRLKSGKSVISHLHTLLTGSSCRARPRSLPDPLRVARHPRTGDRRVGPGSSRTQSPVSGPRWLEFPVMSLGSPR